MLRITILHTRLLRNKLLTDLRWGYDNLPTQWGLTVFGLAGNRPTLRPAGELKILRPAGDRIAFEPATRLLGNNNSNSFQTCLGKRPLSSLLGKHPQPLGTIYPPTLPLGIWQPSSSLGRPRSRVCCGDNTPKSTGEIRLI